MKKKAKIMKRIAAFAIDIIIIEFIIGYPLRLSLAGLMPNMGISESYNYFLNNSSTMSVISSILLSFGIISILYFSILEYKIGQTIGKIFLNIKVSSLSSVKNYTLYLIRSMFCISFFPFILLWILDPLFMFFSKDNKRLGEILSKTITVEDI